MFPMEFDHEVLETLPVLDEEKIRGVLQILKTVIKGRVMPYFRNKRGTDPATVARVGERISINRSEDEGNRVRIASLLSKKEDRWTIHIHERIFDYLAFVIPSDPESRLGGTTSEEGKVLALTEFLLRHQAEHMVYPKKSEREVIRSDVIFAMDRRKEDPTYYLMLRNALADEMNGLRGGPYQALFESAELERPYEYLITRILTSLVTSLANIPDDLLRVVFSAIDTDLKTKLLVEWYRRSRETSDSLIQRASYFQEVIWFFSQVIEMDEKEAEKIFHVFKDRWGLVYLFRELDLPETSLEDKEPEELFVFFKENLKKLSLGGRRPFFLVPSTPKAVTPEPRPTAAPAKSLKERIEEARNNPSFPRQALEVIDKNKTSAIGHSGPKYTELLETLLAIPWGKIHKIQVSPEAFEEGLNRTHYGLERPKEIVCDFFTNLIWRYQHFSGVDTPMNQSGSAFLFVGPPGVGKTSLAISIAENLGIPYHKISLGGMRNESDLRGHGFTYEGSKPGAVVQGLIKMGIMNGMFIMDEADKTEAFAISTLLEILDPEQNHLFHDKYTMSTVDIDLSNCHFVLTANTLETVPPPVVNRCEVILLGRYSVEEKVAIGREHLIPRVRKRYKIDERMIFFDPDQEPDLIRFLIKTYTFEPGVRELERIIRTLFLRILRKEILAKGEKEVSISREKIKKYLEIPGRPRQINEENRIGEMLALGVDLERGLGSLIPIQATRIEIGGQSAPSKEGYLSMVHATGNIEKIMDESRKVATTGIFRCADALGIDLSLAGTPVHLHFMGSSTRKDGPSAGGAIALALASSLSGRTIRRDVAMTGEIDTQGRIIGVGGLEIKLETAYDAGCKTMIIPKENLCDDKGIARLPDALKRELQILTYEDWKGGHPHFDYNHHVLQVVAVDNIVEAADIAFIDQEELDTLRMRFVPHGRSVAETLRTDLKEKRLCLRILYTKEPRELDFEGLGDPFWQGCRPVFLISPRPEKAMLTTVARLESRDGAQTRDFDPSTERLTQVVQEIEDSFSGKPALPFQVSVIAPFFFLKRDGIGQEDFSSTQFFEGLRLFANNYTVQGVKIKNCKPILNRVYFHLAQLKTAQIDACPFLGKREGVYAVDLSFIPEKYRLDVKHAEKILNGCLKEWLANAFIPDNGAGHREERP